MQSNPQNSAKVPVIIAIVVLAAAVIYYFYYSGAVVATDAQSGLAVDNVASNERVGEDVLNLLNQIHSLKIDTKFFKTPVYQSLVDFSVAIPTVNVGRQNPFSAIGSFVQTDQAAPSAGSGKTGGR